jgi:hypothetical protein
MKAHTYPLASGKGTITSTRTKKGLEVVSSNGLKITLQEEMNGAWSDRRILLLVNEVYKHTKRVVKKELADKAKSRL